VGEVLLFNKFFSDCRRCEDMPDKVVRWCRDGDFLRPVVSVSRVQHISDLHSKFAVRPHMCGSMVDIQLPTAEIRRGKKKDRKKDRNHKAKI